MAYENTATRKRPQRFSELVGQEFVTATLAGSIGQGRIDHAYLFAGPRGVGKTSAARILARALNCEQGPRAEPCGSCSSCREITAGNSLDVIEIDGASNTSVNDVREIKDEVLFAPANSRYKVYIIDEVHMLSNSAFNALLKTIEEPPPYIIFIFATTEVHKVPATIRSRCQQFNFRLIGSDQIKACLKAVVDEIGVEAEDQALYWIAKEATGSLRDAYTLLDQVVSFSEGKVTLARMQEKLGIVGIDEINRIGLLLLAGKPGSTLEYAAGLLDRGISIEQFVVDLADYFRNLLFLKNGVRKEALLSFPPDSYSREVLDAFTPAQLEKAVELLLDAYRNIKYSLNPRFEVELALSRMSDLANLITPAEVLESIRRLRKALPGGDGRPGARGGAGGEGGLTGVDGAREAGLAQAGGRAGRLEDRDGGEAAGSFPEARSADRTAGPQDSSQAEPPARIPAPGIPAPGSAREAEGADDERGFLERLVESLRRDKLALASSIQKADSVRLQGEELTLSFQARDKFSGEMVQRERETLMERCTRLLSRKIRLKVRFLEAAAAPARDDRVDLVKKVFRGEVVQKEKKTSDESI